MRRLLIWILFAGMSHPLIAQQIRSQRVHGRVNPAENQTIGSLVPGLPGIPRVARGNQVRLAGTANDGRNIDLSSAIGPDGTFEFSSIPPGKYQVTVSPSSIPPVNLVVNDSEVPELQLGSPLSSILGTVVVADGGPQPRFSLEWTSDSNNRHESVVISASKFAVDFPGGTFLVSAAGLPSGMRIQSMRAEAVDLLREPLTLQAGHTVQIAISLGFSGAPLKKVSGHVSGRVGSVPITSVRLSGEAMAGILTTPVDSEGAFEFANVLPGKYEVRALLSQVRIASTIVVADSDLRDVTVRAPAMKDLAGEFVHIEPGEFMMGCSLNDNQCQPPEMPSHRVGITKAFEIGKYEVTQAQWESVMGTNPSKFKGADRPVENLNTWLDTQEFIDVLNAIGDGYRYRLPTEAEWEYVARAGSTGPYPSAMDDIAWYSNNAGRQTHPVGQKQPNAWGVYDILGNVSEWVEDWYSATYYSESPGLDPRGPLAGSMHFVRGGSVYDIPLWIRVSYRGRKGPVSDRDSYGMRLVREAIAP
jgi:formylglycine-generating enzyme required for sulfatase activity